MAGDQRGDGLRAQLTRPPSPQQPAQLRVELTVEGESPFEPMKPIEFAARAEPWRQDLEYRYHFGDGPPTGWLRDSRFPHTYAGPGSYQVFVEVRPGQRLLAAQDAVRSNVLQVRVVRKEEALPAPPSTSGNRVPSKVIAPAGEPKPEQPGARPDVRHPPSTSGNRVPSKVIAPAGEPKPEQPGAGLDVRPPEAQTGEAVSESPPASVTGVLRAEHRLLLEADTRTPQAGGRVRFTWHVEPALEGLLYLVEFGDSESAWVSHTVAEHTYARPGEYRVLIRARIGGGEVQSNDVTVAVRAADQGPFYLLIAVALAAAGAIVGAWCIIVRFRRRKNAPADDEVSTETSVVVKPHQDPGTQEVEFAAPDSEGSEVRLLPVPDRGEQAMEQGFIIRKKGGGNNE